MPNETEKDVLTRRGFLGVGSAALAAAGIPYVENLYRPGIRLQAQVRQKQKRSRSHQSWYRRGKSGFEQSATHRRRRRADFQVPFLLRPQAASRRWLVPRSYPARTCRLQNSGRRGYAAHRRRRPRTALAHRRGMGHSCSTARARITCIDADGKSFVTDVNENDLWFFPTGIPHSIQGLGPDGCEFLLVFDDGNFSEYETVLLTDWMAHTPPDIVAKNFGVSQEALANMPKKELFIFQADVPGPLEDDRRIAAGKLGPSPIDFAFRTSKAPPTKSSKSGEVRIIDSNNFKISTTSPPPS